MTNIDEQVKKAVKAGATLAPQVLKPAPQVAVQAAPPATVTVPAPPFPALSPVTVPVGVGVAPAPAPPNTATTAGAAVRGHVTLLPGANPSLRVTLTQPGNPSATVSMPVGPDGLFEFLSVRPGSYTVTVSMVPIQPIVVGTQDVTGIEFIVPRIRPVTGRLIIEGTGESGAGLRLTFTVVHPNGSVEVLSAVQANGSFTVPLPVGEHRVALNLPGYSTRSMLFGSTELLREPLRLSATDNAPLIVTLTANTPRGGGTGAGRGANVPPPSSPAPTVSVTEPVLLSQVQPEYSQAARDARVMGSVTLQGIVQTNGMMTNIQVIKGMGWGLDENAIAAVQQWRFRPGTRNGEPVATVISVIVSFSLR